MNTPRIHNVVIEDKTKGEGGQIAKLVNVGLSSATSDWDFFSKIDADMILIDYFERIFEKFDQSQNSEYLVEHAMLWMEKGRSSSMYPPTTPVVD